MDLMDALGTAQALAVALLIPMAIYGLSQLVHLIRTLIRRKKEEHEADLPDVRPDEGSSAIDR
jgi:hypothetical protein